MDTNKLREANTRIYTGVPGDDAEAYSYMLWQAADEIDGLRARIAETEGHRQILTQQNVELLEQIETVRAENANLEAKNRGLDQACRAMLAGDVAAYNMMRKALEG
jgi:FtsZ-binding cell division protein ZapB